MPDFRALLADDSEMARRIRDLDWNATALGPPRSWPQSLRSTLSICLNSDYPIAIYWGPELLALYNDSWARLMETRHPAALGKPAREIWSDIWHFIGPQIETVLRDARAVVAHDFHIPSNRHRKIAEAYWDYSFIPIAGEDGEVAGIFSQGLETTTRVFTDRRNRLLLQLSDRIRMLRFPGDIMATALRTVGENMDVARAAYGEFDPALRAMRIEACWTREAMPALPGALPIGEPGEGLQQALRSGETCVMEDIDADPQIINAQLGQTYQALGIRAMVAIPLPRTGDITAILLVHNAEPCRWSAGEILMLQGVASRLWEDLARSRAETALSESERRHRLVFEQARDIIFTADLEQRITACNPAAAEAIGLPAIEIVGRHIADFVSPDQFERTRSMLRRKLNDGGVTRYEVSVTTAHGEIRQWDVNSALTIDAEGKPIGLHALARDITEKRAFDERQQLLINELNHRVKNTLALVQALAMQSFRAGRTTVETQHIFQARLARLAAVHDLLTQQCWEGATIDALVDDAIAPYRDPPGRIVVSGPRVVLPPKTAISLILTLHELGTNALQYGALSHPEGKVELQWSLAPNRSLTLSWREKGGPEIREPEVHGFGLRMVKRALATDLTGTVNVSFQPTGLDCTITATLPEFA